MSSESIFTDLRRRWRASGLQLQGASKERRAYLFCLRVPGFVATPLDAVVPGDDDGDLASFGFCDLEALRVQGGLQGLQIDQVLEFQVTGGRLALAKLLDELFKTVADPFPGHDVVVLDTVTHLLGQEGLVAERRETV